MAVSGSNVFPYPFNNWIPVNGEMEALLQNTATAHSLSADVKVLCFFHLVSLGMALPSLACRDGVVVPGVSSSSSSLALGQYLVGERLWAVPALTLAVTHPRTQGFSGSICHKKNFCPFSGPFGTWLPTSWVLGAGPGFRNGGNAAECSSRQLWNVFLRAAQGVCDPHTPLNQNAACRDRSNYSLDAGAV